MKKLIKSLVSIAVALGLTAAALSAQSCAAVNSAARASVHGVAASGEASAAGVDSAVSSAQAVSGAVAIPLWISGATVASVGESMAKGGVGATKSADKMWDFSNDDMATRPELDREKSLPSLNRPTVPVKDPSPAEALKTKT